MSSHDSFSRINLVRPPTVIPNELSLHEAEAALGLPFPPSYRDFARQFGYGLLVRLYIIYVPMPGDDSLTERNAVLRNTIEIGVEEDIVDFKPDGSPELLMRLVPFGVSESGDILGWDPLARSETGEYPIFMLGPRNAGVSRSASDLYDFVEKCLAHAERGRLTRRTGPVDPVFEPVIPRND
jgi:hypothetical protein